MEEKTGMEEALLAEGSKKGGFRTIPFIIANEAFEKIASFGLSLNMILYLMNEYHLGMASGSNILYLWSSATNLFPVIAAYLADSFLGRYRMIAYGSIFSLLGTVILWLTAMIPQARPTPCTVEYSASSYCTSPTIFQLVFLCSSFLIMSIGAGGIRSASMAFGADQLQDAQTLKKTGAMETYLSWYNSMTAFSVVIAMSCIVYIQENFGWKVGFGVPAVLMFLSAISFFLASSFYVRSSPQSSLITGFVQVIVASYKKRNLILPPNENDLLYHHSDDSVQAVPTEKLRFLNKSCIIEDPKSDLNPDGSPSNPWRLCSVDQVENVKKLIALIPLWSTGILMSVNVGQTSFPILQANSMNRHITKNFQIPAASFSMFMIISMVAWVAIYDRILIPVVSRILGRPARMSPITRMGLGIFFSFLSMSVRAIVEGVRRSIAIREGFIDNPKGIVSMSAFWLLPQNALMGVAEAFNVVGQMELYLSELPSGMSSISTSLSGIGMSLGGLLASFIMTTVDGVSKRGGHDSWIADNINRGRYDYYYIVLACLCLVNIFYFMVCSKIYGGSKRSFIN